MHFSALHCICHDLAKGSLRTAIMHSPARWNELLRNCLKASFSSRDSRPAAPQSRENKLGLFNHVSDSQNNDRDVALGVTWSGKSSQWWRGFARGGWLSCWWSIWCGALLVREWMGIKLRIQAISAPGPCPTATPSVMYVPSTDHAHNFSTLYHFFP